MKYRLAQSLMQKEEFRSAARMAGKCSEPGDIRKLDKNSIGKPTMQFKYCWQSNDNKRPENSNRLNENNNRLSGNNNRLSDIFKNPEIK